MQEPWRTRYLNGDLFSFPSGGSRRILKSAPLSPHGGYFGTTTKSARPLSATEFCDDVSGVWWAVYHLRVSAYPHLLMSWKARAKKPEQDCTDFILLLHDEDNGKIWLSGLLFEVLESTPLYRVTRLLGSQSVLQRRNHVERSWESLCFGDPWASKRSLVLKPVEDKKVWLIWNPETP